MIRSSISVVEVAPASVESPCHIPLTSGRSRTRASSLAALVGFPELWIRWTALLLANAMLLLGSARCLACFSIVVGKSASADGWVLVAHNEDDSPPQIVNHHKVPRLTHALGEMITLRNGGRLEQVPETWAYLWSELPGMEFSDSYVNEWGVCVTSDNCPSREQQGELTDGGIGYMLRRVVAERAETARDGVRIAGALVDRFGYVASGRTYIIADSQEGWLFCVMQGKHWLARRVGDDEVAMVANTYTVREVDLSDSQNVVASKGILSHAVERGWYDPVRDDVFNFAAVFADPRSADAASNYGRQSIGLRYVAAHPPAFDNKPPFSVATSKKLGVADLIRVLRHAGSRNAIRTVDGQQVACDLSQAICRGSTQTSFVARLGTEPSRDLGIVYWACLAAPETSVFLPFHFGIADFPTGFRVEAERPSQEVFVRKVTASFVPDPSQAYWTFANFRNKTEFAPDAVKARILQSAESIEADFLATVENPAKEEGMASGKALGEHLQRVSAVAYKNALDMMAANEPRPSNLNED